MVEFVGGFIHEMVVVLHVLTDLVFAMSWLGGIDENLSLVFIPGDKNLRIYNFYDWIPVSLSLCSFPS